MKTFILSYIFILLLVAIGHGQDVSSISTMKGSGGAMRSKAATLSLPRLDAQAHPGMLSRLAVGKFEFDALEAPSGVVGIRRAQQSNVGYLALDPSIEWSRPLRSNPRGITYVSLNLHASFNTVIDAGGAWLSVAPSNPPGRAALMMGKETGGGIAWDRVGIDCPLDHFAGRELAVMPIVTVRIDSVSGTWDLYSGVRQVVHAMQLVRGAKNGAPQELTVRAGSAGVWLNAVAVCDENPLFADDNANGVDDAYELNKKGALLLVHATASERKALALEWQRAQRAIPPTPLMAVRPLPDRLIAKIAGKEKEK